MRKFAVRSWIRLWINRLMGFLFVDSPNHLPELPEWPIVADLTNELAFRLAESAPRWMYYTRFMGRRKCIPSPEWKLAVKREFQSRRFNEKLKLSEKERLLPVYIWILNQE